MGTENLIQNARGDEQAESLGAGIQEVAVYLSRITDLPFREAIYWKRLLKEVRRSGVENAHIVPDPDLLPLFALRKGNARPVRIYYGNEFCQQRIPETGEFEASCAAVHEAGLPLTFMTSPVNDDGCEMLFHRLTNLQDWLPGSEVVVNDWGVLRLVHQTFPSLKPVLGRLMSKFLRDPRITPRYCRPDAPPEALRALQQCSLNISAYHRLLARYGVRRVELDNLYQGIGMDFAALDLLPSLYIPFGYVTTGRICLMGNEHLPQDQKFDTPNELCPRPCLRVEIDLADRNARADGGVYAFTQRGNTIFYRQNGPLISHGLAWAAQQEARLVYQPELPF